MRSDIEKDDFRFGQDKAKDDAVRIGERNCVFSQKLSRKGMKYEFGVVRIRLKLVQNK